MPIFNIKANKYGGMYFIRIGIFCFSFCISRKPWYGVDCGYDFDAHVMDYLIGMSAQDEADYWADQELFKTMQPNRLCEVYRHSFDEHVFAWECAPINNYNLFERALGIV